MTKRKAKPPVERPTEDVDDFLDHLLTCSGTATTLVRILHSDEGERHATTIIAALSNAERYVRGCIQSNTRDPHMRAAWSDLTAFLEACQNNHGTNALDA